MTNQTIRGILLAGMAFLFLPHGHAETPEYGETHAASEEKSSRSESVEPEKFSSIYTPKAEHRKEAKRFWDTYSSAHPEFQGKMRNIEKVAAEPNYPMFDIKDHSTEEIFYFLSLTPRGRELLSSFLPKVSAGDLKIDDKRSKKGQEIIEKYHMQSAGAFFHEGVIYVDHSYPLAALAPYFLHEGVHGLRWLTPEGKRAEKVMEHYELAAKAKAKWEETKSKDDWETFQKYDKLAPQDLAFQTMFAEEHPAYAAQDSQMKEMRKLDPNFDAMFRLLHQSKWLFSDRYDDKTFVAAIGGNSDSARQYLSRVPWSTYR